MFRVSLQELAIGGTDWSAPVALIDLDGSESVLEKGRDSRFPALLPPCPVIGIGRRDHPFAPHLDTIVEPGFSTERVVESVLAQPQASAVTAQLLRILPQLDPALGLVAESFAYATLQGGSEHGEWLASRPSPPSQPDGRVTLARREDALFITLDRPQAGNAIDRPMRDALSEAFALADLDRSISRVVLGANGRAFSLGAELSEFGTTRDTARAHAIRQATLPARLAARCSARLEARIDGACIGAGLELAAYAARVTATRRSWFQLPELAMGVLPGAGGCVSLTQRIGRQRTLLLALSGRRLSAARALEWGLVDALVDEPAGSDGGDDIA